MKMVFRQFLVLKSVGVVFSAVLLCIEEFERVFFSTYFRPG
jgi:hypothetical protein